MTEMERGRTLKALRVAAGLTQRQVADHFGIDKASVSEWERDKGRPTVDKLPVLDKMYRANGAVLGLWAVSPNGDYTLPASRAELAELAGFVKVLADQVGVNSDDLADLERRLSAPIGV